LRAWAIVCVVACTPTQTQTPPTPTTSASADASTTATPVDYHASLVSTACVDDSDCAVTNFTGCCQPCPGPVTAASRVELERRQKACMEVECAATGRVKCDPADRPEDYRAACHDKVCLAVKTAVAAPVARAELTSEERCTKDDECVVTNFSSCCSECQTSAYATSKKAYDARQRVCAAVDCASVRAPRCAPIVDASLYRVACRAGVCGGVKR
jgi:hypothetical protein